MKISELPKEYQDLVPPKEERKDRDTNDINRAFIWRRHFPGQIFWHDCHNATEKGKLPEIPPKPKEGFNIISTGTQCKAEIIEGGISKGYVGFKRQEMSNCGMIMFRSFHFPSRKYVEKYKDEIFEFYRECGEGYPYMLATHNENYKGWFKDLGWEQIDEFFNPNSDNYVQIWKFDREN